MEYRPGNKATDYTPEMHLRNNEDIAGNEQDLVPVPEQRRGNSRKASGPCLAAC